MKRAVNNVPLNTIMGLIPGYTEVVIENRLEKDLWNDTAEGTERWSGYAMDFHKAAETIRYKWGATKVRKIDMDGKGIRVIISTQYEAY